MHPVTLERAVLDHLYYTCGKDERSAGLIDVYDAVAHAVRDRLAQRWQATQRTYYEQDVKRVYYLCAEFLLGRALGANLLSLGIHDMAEELLQKHGLDARPARRRGSGPRARQRRPRAARRVLPRLDGDARARGHRLRHPLRVRHLRAAHPRRLAGRARRRVAPRREPVGDAASGQDGPRQLLRACHRLDGRPRALPRPLGRRTDRARRAVRHADCRIRDQHRQHPAAVVGAGFARVRPRGVQRRRLPARGRGEGPQRDHLQGALSERRVPRGQGAAAQAAVLLRRLLDQRHHAALQEGHRDFERSPTRWRSSSTTRTRRSRSPSSCACWSTSRASPWERAWDITRATIAYTNHTLLPEALERWPVAMFERMLPRHLQIIHEINRRFLREVQIHAPTDDGASAHACRSSRRARRGRSAWPTSPWSAPTASTASRSSTRSSCKSTCFPDFAEMWPERFNNKTNGVTPRRWLLLANPRLAAAITKRIGDGWVTDLSRLEQLLRASRTTGEFARGAPGDQAHEQGATSRAYSSNERNRVESIRTRCSTCRSSASTSTSGSCSTACTSCRCTRTAQGRPGTRRRPADVRLRRARRRPATACAKLHIKLINDVADTINADPRGPRPAQRGVRGQLRRLAGRADDPRHRRVRADLARRARRRPGTGNMKFAMNGALTVGTLDGANIEIREAVGERQLLPLRP